MLTQRLRNPGLALGLVIFSFGLVSERRIIPDVNRNVMAMTPAHQSAASGMAVVVNGGTVPGISLIDPVTDTACPFLSGMLGAPGTELLDCIVTPDGNTAIVSNFSAQRLFFIDVGTLPPSLLGSVSLPIPAEDLALTPDGRFVLATDGGGTPGLFTPRSVGVVTRTVVSQFLGFGFFGAQSVDVAPDSRTVVITDAGNGFIMPLQLNSDGTFALEGSTGTISVERPGNVTIAPDGQTAVVCNITSQTLRPPDQATGLDRRSPVLESKISKSGPPASQWLPSHFLSESGLSGGIGEIYLRRELYADSDSI